MTMLVVSAYTLISEIFFSMWVEIAIAIVAALTYFGLVGWSGTAPKHASRIQGVFRPAAPRVGRTTFEDARESQEHRSAFEAIQQGDLRKAIAILQHGPDSQKGGVPKSLGAHMLSAAAMGTFPDSVLIDLKVLTGRLSAEALEMATLDALRRGDIAGCRKLHGLAADVSIPLSHRTLRALAKAYADDDEALRNLVREAQAPIARPFAEAVLEACTSRKNVELAAEVFEKVDSSDTSSLRAFVERVAAGSAARSRSGVTRDLVVHAKAIRAYAKSKDLQAAVSMFERLYSENVVGTPLYNSVLDACVECQDLDRALKYFQQAKEQCLVDPVSFNILMKGYLGRGDIQAAESTLADLRSSGLGVTAASYNGLLGYRVQSGDHQGAWRIVEEMRANGILIGVVTCSILLRSHSITGPEVDRVVSMIDAKDEPMDEALFSALVDACVRTGNLRLLTRKRDEYVARGGRVVLSAPTYGSMIKAYGQARDLEQVWGLWQEMINNDVKPTPITFGCMVEALVANGATMEAKKLANQLWEDEQQRPLVNTVIYSTILKGFANSKESKEVMTLYEQMRSRGIRPNTITYNTILNAFAQCAAMDRVPALLEDMRSADPPVEPDLVTYSTLVKGFCTNGDVDRGLKILEQMTQDGELAPDEVMYNSLLDGCAKEQRLDDALRLMDDMKQRGVAPSNYTLSMLVKLMGRCKRLGQAFSLIETLSKEHGFRVNIQVYTCLIQACFKNRQVVKALALHDQILCEGLCPDEKVYTSLVRGCVQSGAVDHAVRMLRHAYGLDGCEPAFPYRGGPPGVESRCLDELVWKLGGESASEAAALLAEVRSVKVRAPPPMMGGRAKGGGKGGAGRGPRMVR